MGLGQLGSARGVYFGGGDVGLSELMLLASATRLTGCDGELTRTYLVYEEGHSMRIYAVGWPFLGYYLRGGQQYLFGYS